jgi:hypothetical protein
MLKFATPLGVNDSGLSASHLNWASKSLETGAATFRKDATLALRKWRRVGCGPRFVRYGGRLVRYARTDMYEWLERNKFTSEAEELSATSKK